jgi:hypothetical protein
MLPWRIALSVHGSLLASKRIAQKVVKKEGQFLFLERACMAISIESVVIPVHSASQVTLAALFADQRNTLPVSSETRS